MDKYTLGEVAYKNGYEKGFQDGINHEKQVKENNNYAYQVTMSKEDMDKIPTMSKKTIQECKDYLKKMGIVDTNSKEYIETQAYNKFEERILTRLIDKIATLKELFKGNMYVEQSIKTMNCVIDDIKDIRNELTKEVEDNYGK